MQPRLLKHYYGFTLTELLVVLGIIAVLTAILLPVLWQARQKGQQTVCVSNLRQISTALSLYVSDYEGVFPVDEEAARKPNGVTHAGDSKIWRDLLLPYLNGRFPECPCRVLPGIFAQNYHDRFLSGYAYNQRLNRTFLRDGKEQSYGKNEAALSFPSLTVSVIETRTGFISTDRPDTMANWKKANLLKISDYNDLLLAQPPGATRHSGGANYAFADGHARWYRPEQLSIHAHSDGIHPGFGL